MNLLDNKSKVSQAGIYSYRCSGYGEWDPVITASRENIVIHVQYMYISNEIMIEQ